MDWPRPWVDYYWVGIATLMGAGLLILKQLDRQIRLL
jgi:hypothetical protein